MLIGTPLGGGFYAGQIRVFAGQEGGGLPAADTIYNLIVAPAASGTSPSLLEYNINSVTDTNPPSQNQVYGNLASTLFNDADHPGFQFAKGLSIAGFTDWYVPAQYELEILYFNLKPNSVSSAYFAGANPNAVPPRTTYTSTVPGLTTADGTNGTANFQAGGSEAFNSTAAVSSSVYWSSTEESSAPLNANNLVFSNGGNLSASTKQAPASVRAIRRVVA
jgi:hypothetical protein